MCGRVRLDTDWTEIVRIFDLDVHDLDGFVPHWNVAPTMTVPLLYSVGGRRRAMWGSWGFVPAWDRSAKPKQRPINAKAETVATSGMFKTAFRERRCAVPITGFYEWETLPDGKQPWLFARRDRGLFVVAGVWSRWQPEGAPPVDTFCVLTTGPNGVTGRVHDRMPVVLPDGAALDLWLNPTVEPGRLSRLLVPCEDVFLDARRVSRAMNSARLDTAEACAVLD